MYRPNFYESTCFRCNEIVYQVDRVGPLKDFTFFHSGCFKCAVCRTKLTLKTYFNNQHYTEDKEVYCSSHVPKIGPGHLDNSSVGIRSALNVPRSNNYVNEQIRGLARNIDNERESDKVHHLDNSSVGIRSALNVPRSNNYVNEQIRGLARNIDNERDALNVPRSNNYVNEQIRGLARNIDNEREYDKAHHLDNPSASAARSTCRAATTTSASRSAASPGTLTINVSIKKQCHVAT
ncbi:LIM domain-containing protein D-like [Cydia splendana]|uniref:LIM domain-containing protein D-like n=1 Tax=Cydia splendana TaxID=1100963 RepID=UPI00300C3331